MQKLEIPAPQAVSMRQETIAVFTYSANIYPPDMEPHMSALSQFVADIALAGWGETDANFVVASERSFTGRQTTGELMHSYFEEKMDGDPRMKLINESRTGEDLNNTSQQVEALAEERRGKSGSALIVAMSYHIPRIARHANYYGLDMNFVAADKLWYETEVQAGMKKYEIDKSLDIKVMRAIPEFAKRERIVNALTFFDGRGLVTAAGNKLWGSCLHDVDLDTGEAIISTIPKRRRELAELREAA